MDEDKQFDTVIIGAGSAGSILAARLTEDLNRSVLLVEAGPDYPDVASLPDEVKHGYGVSKGVRGFTYHDWTYQAQATETAKVLHIPRGKITGGSSAVNGQIFLRGEPDDFDRWAAMGNDLWSFEQVLPYFKKIERDLDFSDGYHGVDGPTPVRRYPRAEWLPDQLAYYEASRAMGFPDCPDHNRPYTTGVGAVPLNCIDRIRYSTALTYLAEARQRPNLTVKANGLVHRILFEGRRAKGITVAQEGSLETITADEIIVSAGALGSPQLLMLSGIGPAEHLHTLDIPVLVDLPGVGQNLRDHPTVNMHWAIHDDVLLERPLEAQKPWHQVILRYTAPGSSLVNDMIIYSGVNTHDRIFIMRPTINLAESAGELRLRTSDPTAPPYLNYRYFSTPFDQERQRAAVHFCHTLTAYDSYEAIIAYPIKPIDADLASDNALDHWIQREADTGHHSAGTCKMGPTSDPMAVVDQTQ
ncbi:GMC family oxidoreductase N-terminal domain-containing protein [Chloroflexi bacterium TSY]|nr:GMC family oxidoreductase N-terminal domain-containing protein [Chloroflexi bacterium TSY]